MKKLAVMAISAIMSLTIAIPTFSAGPTSHSWWINENGRWKYQLEKGYGKQYTGKPRIVTNQGHLYAVDADNYMLTGWFRDARGYWYYFDPESGQQVRAQWIEGTYYVGNDGRMFVDEFTPDNYYVGPDGKYVEGISTTRQLEPTDRNTKQPPSAFTGEPLDGGALAAAYANAKNESSSTQPSEATSESSQVLVEGNVSSVGRISAPLPDEIMGGFCYAVNSADGVKVRWKATNLTGKTVKYYSVGIAVKNPVGDYCLDQITKEDVKWLKYVGPVAPGEDFIVFDIVGYYGAPHEIIIPLIELEYMDGTKEMVEYLYSTTEQHQRIL